MVQGAELGRNVTYLIDLPWRISKNVLQMFSDYELWIPYKH